MPTNHEIRIAIAEAKLVSHEHLIELMQTNIRGTMDRLDTHIQSSVARDERIRDQLGEVSVAMAENNVAVSNLSTAVAEATDVLRGVSQTTKDNELQLVRWDTVVKTITKVAAVVTIVVSGIWTVYTFVSVQPETTIQGTKK